jgi:hypothetical protein
MRELEKISYRHKRGKFNMPEKDFLELVFCPYYGNGVMDREPLKKYLREREMKAENESKLNLPLVAEKKTNLGSTVMTSEANSHDFDHTMSKKENEERIQREQEYQLISENSNLHKNVLDLFRDRTYQPSVISDAEEAYYRRPSQNHEDESPSEHDGREENNSHSALPQELSVPAVQKEEEHPVEQPAAKIENKPVLMLPNEAEY